MTLRLEEDGSVVTVPLPKTIQGIRDGVDHFSSCRGKGLLLRSVTFPLPESGRDRAGTGVKVGHCAA